LVDSDWPKTPERATRGLRFLRAAQLPDGSWPSTPEEKVGCWVTSLACWVLLVDKDSRKAVAAGLRWLCQDWPSDSTLWRRWLARFSSQRQVAPINDSLRGWGWTPRTSSWVEPTSFALLVLAQCPRDLLPAAAARRQRLGEGMLYDRMCPGGGWNCGNPRVYGVAGEPLVVPTAWALLALRDHPGRSENTMSLAWLQASVGSIQGAGSLALARICLETNGLVWPANAPKLRDFYGKNEFLQSVQVAAWACLASIPRRNWLTAAAGGRS
jgi:hypothetical protein